VPETEPQPVLPHDAAPTLAYERVEPQPTGPRPWWVWAIIGLYGVMWAAVLTMPMWGAWASDDGVVVPSAIFAASLVICGLILMILPVRSIRRRPVSRRTIWLPVVASGLLAGALVVGGGLALLEYFRIGADWAGTALAIGAGLVWAGWSVLFMMIGFSRGPLGIGMKLHRWLIAGSVLELLVAVPTHVVVRRRPECCAGIGTGIGICLGVGVMFVSFGPSVLLLFHRRRKQISNSHRVS
jgi:hypothetical protein